MIKTSVVKAQLGVLMMLVSVYFLQVATPLRLHPDTDTALLLLIAESAASGGGFLYHGHPTVFPPGYPALVVMLMKLRLAHVWVFIGINVIFLMIGFLALRKVFGSMLSDHSALGICILSLLSFVFIKYTALVLTDPLFFGVAMCALAVMTAASGHLTLRTAVLSVALVITAICIRRIGVALIPALLWMTISPSEARLYIRRLPVRTTVAIAGALGITIAWVVHTTSTLFDFTRVVAGHTVIESARVIWTFRLTELGEITVNLPHTALPPIVQRLLSFIGALVFALVLAGVVSRRKQFSVVDAFFVSYLAVLLVWPYYDPRFWLPVIPLLIAYSGVALKLVIQHHPGARQLVVCHVLIFSSMGLVALASNTAISFSGSTFADVYPVERYHAAYCAVLHCKEVDSSPIDPDVLHLLRYYEQK